MPGELPHTSSPGEQAAIAAALKKSKLAAKVEQEIPPQPSPTSFLRPSQHFKGAQRVAHVGLGPNDEDWCVSVNILSCDMETGTVCGTMEAENVPHTRSPVTTFWEGEIVDNMHHTFFTGRWGASADTDLKHWSKFDSFMPLKDSVRKARGYCDALGSYPFLFMRWKEKYFVNCSQECGLTIAGFYYVCLNRLTGSVVGYYYDPNSSPFQKLELYHKPQGTAGHSFAEFSLL